ncbi:hypothetical protein IQ07DRAFT_14820 [Pyrenochaeta sp. DS3sAY3a]|nr:hypothetical protein IQ07DRAFT_14820 [Pyrenochaeta sp. DS3sAY3a]
MFPYYDALANPEQKLINALLRIRRIKCDEAKPNCEKCTSTGRKCDGYTTSPSPATDSSTASPEAVSPKTTTGPITLTKVTTSSAPSAPWSAFTVTVPNDITNQMHAHPPLSSLHAFPIPSSMGRAFDYFVNCASADLAGPFCIQVWGQYVLGISAVSPAVQHGVVALSGFHEMQSSRRRRGVAVSSASKEESWRHYYLAVKETNRTVDAAQGGLRLSGTSKEEVLVSCAIFITIEVLLGNLKTAVRHLEGAYALLRTHFCRSRPSSINTANPQAGDTPTSFLRRDSPDTSPSPPPTPVYVDDQMADLIGFFARLDLQMLAFLPPGEYAAHKTSQHPISALPQIETPLLNPRSASLFRIIKDSLYWLRHVAVEWKYSACIPADVYEAQARFLRELQTWRADYFSGENEGCGYPGVVDGEFDDTSTIATTTTDPQTANLLLAHALTALKLRTALSPTETAFLAPDSLSIFSAILAHASTILSHRNHTTTTNSSNTTPPSAPSEATTTATFSSLVSVFSLEISTVEALYYTAIKCRDKVLRRRALELLRCAGREGVWDGGTMARVAGCVVGVEEESVRCSGEEGGLVSEVNFTVDTEGGIVEVDCGWFLAGKRRWRREGRVVVL